MNLVHEMAMEILQHHNNQVHTALVALLTRRGISFPDIRLEQYHAGPTTEAWTDVIYRNRKIMRYTMPAIVQDPTGSILADTVYEYHWKIEIIDSMMEE